MRDRREPPPSAQARLAAELDGSLSRTRLAWEAASLRGDAALRVGDRAEAVRALDEQRALLVDLHAQVDQALGRAAVVREAETVVAAPGDRTPPPAGPVTRWRAPAGAVTGAVLAAALGLVALLPGAPPVPDVAGVAADLPSVDDAEAPPGAARDGEQVEEPLGPSSVEVAGDARPLGPWSGVFDRVSDVLDELHEVLAGPDEAPERSDLPRVEAPGPAGEDGAAADEPAEAAPHDDVDPDAPEPTPLDRLPGALEPDPEDEGQGQGSVPDDPPGRLDLNGRLGGGAPDGGASTIDGLVDRLDPR